MAYKDVVTMKCTEGQRFGENGGKGSQFKIDSLLNGIDGQANSRQQLFRKLNILDIYHL